MNILITGATGKIGKMLSGELAAEGQYKIIALLIDDDRSQTDEGIKVCRGDLSDLASLRNALKDIGPIDTALHLAAVTHARSKSEYYNSNFEGTKNLLKVGEELGIKRIIFISSRAACAGGGDYAESKLAAENEIKKSKLNWLILSLGEVYSINGKDEINRLYKMINNHYFIPVIGKGQYKLAPVYVEDAAEAVINAVKRNNLSGKRYIICGPEEFSYKELVEVIISFKGLKRQIVNIPLNFLKFVFWLASIFKTNIIAYDQLDRLIVGKPSDISEARRDLGFNPRKMSEGLRILEFIPQNQFAIID